MQICVKQPIGWGELFRSNVIGLLMRVHGLPTVPPSRGEVFRGRDRIGQPCITRLRVQDAFPCALGGARYLFQPKRDPRPSKPASSSSSSSSTGAGASEAPPAAGAAAAAGGGNSLGHCIGNVDTSKRCNKCFHSGVVSGHTSSLQDGADCLFINVFFSSVQ